MINLIKTVLLSLFLVAPGLVQAEVTDTPKPVVAGVFAQVNPAIPLFAEEGDLRIELIADFNNFLNLPESDDFTKVEARLVFYNAQGVAQEINVKLSTRGQSKQRFCKRFRPIRIYFDKKHSDLSVTPFEGISDDLKVATHCDGLGVIKDSNEHVQRNLREQTAYKMLEALGFMTLKTRSARITYKNLDGSLVADAHAFFLEPKSNMAERYGLKHIKQFKADLIFAPEPENKIAFSMSTRFLMHHDVDGGGKHNTILVTADGQPKALTMVPYDFDLTGMVLDKNYTGSAWSKQWSLEGWGDDGEWFKKWVGAKYLSQGYINNSYAIAEYALSHKTEVLKVIDASPVIDKSLIQERVNAFFSGLERALNEK